ncbi:MAG: RluA family pseudouridine synthase [Candidatus Adiutrix sp.]
MPFSELEDYFEPPYPSPEKSLALSHLEPYVTGPIPCAFKGGAVCDLVMKLTHLSASEAKILVEFGAVWLDDRPCFDPEKPLQNHHFFRINPPAYGPIAFYEAEIKRIVFEDDDFLIYNKEAGRPSQGVPYDAYNNALAGLTRLFAGREKKVKLWLLHRLDADTSGLLLFAKSRENAAALGKLFQRGEVEKEYLCLGAGTQEPQQNFTVKTFIAKESGRYINKPTGPGLLAHTDFQVLEQRPPQGDNPHKILFLAKPRTGRTHQIRLHLKWAAWPIIGDRFYGAHLPAPRLMLMAVGLTFKHPRTQKIVSVNLNNRI